MKRFIYPILFLSLAFLLKGQQSVLFIQKGLHAQSYPNLLIGGYSDSLYKKVNDSTTVFNCNVKEPECLFVALDTKTRWFARIWITPTQKQKSILIDYSNKSVSTNPKDEWDYVTEKTLRLEQAQQFAKSDSIAISYINSNPKSYFSLWLLSHGLYRDDREKRVSAFKKLDPSLSNYSEYNQMKADLWQRKYPKEGDSFKDFDLLEKNGRIYSTTKIKDKWILLIFWSNGCGPCIKELDSLAELYKATSRSKIEFISISLDDKMEIWKSSKHSKKIIWPSVWQKDNFYGDLCLNYNVTSMPFFVLFNADKKIHSIRDGANELESIKLMIKEQKLLSNQ